MPNKKSVTISKLQLFTSLFFSLLNTVFATLIIAIYLPTDPIERMSAAGLFLPIIWLVVLLIGLLARNIKYALAWQCGLLFLFLAIIAIHFL